MDRSKAYSLIEAAMGRSESDLVIRNAEVVDVYSRSSFRSDVFIKDGMIVGFGGERKAKAEA